jgi:hypothetical protein
VAAVTRKSEDRLAEAQTMGWTFNWPKQIAQGSRNAG